MVQTKATIALKEKTKGLSKTVINIIRTTQRNNIELTAIADNKANVLLSLNAFILAALIPYTFTNMEAIFENFLIIPLSFAAITCAITIYLTAQVLRPSDFDKRQKVDPTDVQPSPFFFGNFYHMTASEYYASLEEGLSDENLVKGHLAQDLYFIGQRLGVKMSLIRTAFNVFIIGVFVTLISTVLVLSFS